MKHRRRIWIVVLAIMLIEGLSGCGREKTRPEVPLQDFIVNLSGAQKTYLKASIVLQAGSRDDKKVLEKNKSIVRNVIIEELRKIDANQARDPDPDLMPRLRKQLAERVNEALKASVVEDILFTTFVFQ